MVLGLDVEGADKAFPLNVLREARVINDNLGGAPILIVHQPGSDTTTAFSARLNGKSLQFTSTNPDATEITDLDTHSRWDPYGHALFQHFWPVPRPRSQLLELTRGFGLRRD